MANSKNTPSIFEHSEVDRENAIENNLLLTDLGIKRRRESNAAFHLVPFLLKVLEIEKSELTDAISKSIVELDDLAQQIDAVIDIDNSPISNELSYTKFKNLELKIVECFSYFTGLPKLEILIADTLKCVNTSFNYNTVGRHTIYNLKNTEFNGCTTFYLFPLVKYLFSLSKFAVTNERFFFLIANYIQILDDYIDVFDDRDLQIKTPVTDRLHELESSHPKHHKTESSFQLLTDEVFETLYKYFYAIQFEAKQINKNISNEVFSEWQIFHNDFQKIIFPMKANEKELKKYQKEIMIRIPQIVCYTG